jgi:hypothetical protein
MNLRVLLLRKPEPKKSLIRRCPVEYGASIRKLLGFSTALEEALCPPWFWKTNP